MSDEISGRSDSSFFGHPRGLGYIVCTDVWEKFSYFGMQTLLVLYMVDELLRPEHLPRVVGFGVFREALERVYGGPLSALALASAVFGLYTGLAFLTPIAGGLLADRWWGRTRTIVTGALLMMAGHFLMAVDVTFLIALFCLLTGVGCFKGNLASQIGALYPPDDARRAAGYQIYYLCVSGANIVAPLIAGTLGELYGWHYGFAAAGAGMLISIAIYLSGRRYLPPEPAASRPSGSPRAPLTSQERRTVVALIALLPVLAVGAVGNEQIFNAYLIWVPANVDLVFHGFRMPTTWVITIDALVAVAAIAASVAFWRHWAKSRPEPSELGKITIGLAITTLGLLALAMAAAGAADGQRAGLGWLLVFEVCNGIGWANIYPVGLAFYARAAPAAVSGTMIGVFYLHLFFSNNLVGWLGGLLERMSGTRFWLLHAALVAAATACMGAAAWLLRRRFGAAVAAVRESRG